MPSPSLVALRLKLAQALDALERGDIAYAEQMCREVLEAMQALKAEPEAPPSRVEQELDDEEEGLLGLDSLIPPAPTSPEPAPAPGPSESFGGGGGFDGAGAGGPF